VRESKDDSLLLAQTFSAVVGGTALILATTISQRRRAEHATEELAETLQAALLPPELPPIPKMETAAWYRAGTQGQKVGGDFYDVFQTAADEWVAVIGDVCGRGAEAASLTAVARYTLRAVAPTTHRPSTVLRHLNEAIIPEREDETRFITIAYARVSPTPTGHVVTVSNGGHPSPLLLKPDGEVTEVGQAGHLLGVMVAPRLDDHDLAMGPGDALVLFTDGLVEDRSAPMDTGSWIRDILRRCAGASAGEIAERVQREALARGGLHRDDIALLVLRAAPVGAEAVVVGDDAGIRPQRAG
jgi:sigma-B regulation protein RsbU (phosphoserine phosphatase)